MYFEVYHYKCFEVRSNARRDLVGHWQKYCRQLSVTWSYDTNHECSDGSTVHLDTADYGRYNGQYMSGKSSTPLFNVRAVPYVASCIQHSGWPLLRPPRAKPV